ncbi:FMN-binding negative transcriptional regulator [Aquincola sp. MAHUQ-54]|uniref:FMN-binding negative transcriptional regulator n=1 Tax=Aquincola agrisoli TaxID=3119538 RepID=A0AAW9Q0B2_9BURK
MYQPRHFEQPDTAALHALMRERPLATLVVHTPASGLQANLLPLLLDPEAGPHGTLRGHVARANGLWRDAAGGIEALALFQGAQAYVSPAWYPGKQEHGKVVPTWNYAVVEARGVLAAVDDAAWLRRLVGELTQVHEAGRAQPWSVDDAPADYVDQMLRAIVGIELRLTALTGKWKVSQNRSDADRLGVAAGLASLQTADAAAMAALVKPG